MKPKILVVGSFVMDLIVTTERFCNAGETVIGNGFSTAPGGKGANQAVQAARLGAEVTMVGKVGNDDFGRNLIDSAKKSGVNTDYVFVTESAPTAVGNVQIQKKATGTENRIIVAPGANFELTAEEVSFLEDKIQEFDMVILQHEIPQSVNLKVAKYAKAKGVPVMLNPAPSTEVPKELISCLTYISPNEHEAEDISGVKPEGDEAINKAVSALHNMGVKNVLITLGKDGCVLSDGSGIIESPSIDIAPVIDPTAAGDSFIGAFCTATAAGVSVEEALVFANFTAGITVSRMGAQTSLPTFREVMSAMKAKGFATESYNVIKDEKMDALKSFIDISRAEFEKYVESIDMESVKKAAEIIIAAKNNGNRLHITGIGKPAHIAGYAASLISSTGTPAYFLHGTEAVHGSCGQLSEGDIVICISNSGETAELKATAMAIKNNGCKIIAITGKPDSWLGKYGEVCLAAGVVQEGGALNRAPRASILAETYMLQCLSVVLQESAGITPAEYIKRHPGGSLGQLRHNEK